MINIVMSFVLIVSTTGFTVSKHYCGNDFIGLAINKEAKTCCGTNSQCCHTESEHVQLEQDFLGQFLINEFLDYETELLFLLSFSTTQFESEDEVNSILQLNNLPPPPKILTTLSLLQTYLC